MNNYQMQNRLSFEVTAMCSFQYLACFCNDKPKVK